jgi:hypothetical protein
MDTGTHTVTVAMFSEEFQGWGDSAFRGIGCAQLDNAGTTGVTLQQPSNVDLAQHFAHQSGELTVRSQEHLPAPAEDVISGFAVSPMSDAAHSSSVYPQVPSTPAFIVRPKRQEKAKLKRKRITSETDDDPAIDEDIRGLSIGPNVPRANPNRLCVHSVSISHFPRH